VSKRSQRGQMAIFVALIFQILFVFFAMAVNVALVVHDKINLQNAVDLSAYYAAQRQAEMLNVIAHTNYQIRQSWKLLNWRYYVLGTMGMGEQSGNRYMPHPSRPQANYPRNDEQPWDPVAKTPVLCVTYQPIWMSSGSGDNACKTTNFVVRNIEIPKTIAPFTPTNLIFEGLARRLQQKIAASCTEYAGQNWLFGALSFVSYMRDQQNRKELIRALARNMMQPADKMVDLNGESVFEGARKTFMKNLTTSNFESESTIEFDVYNSLNSVDNVSDWLPEVDIIFTMNYSDLEGDADSCRSVTKQIFMPPSAQAWRELVRLVRNEDNLTVLMENIQTALSIGVGDSRRLSLGVEKNPWYLAYVAVKARSKPRQIFLPFVEPVTIEAVAYAQPFGGRIGPWYGRTWSREAKNSEGDRLQISPEKLLANGIMNSNKPENLMPQYAKYPSDLLGLKSVLAQDSLINQRDIQTSISDYFDITADFDDSSANDVLAYSENPKSNIREYEIAAIAPDLFDITYYSIQSNFGTRYLDLLRGNQEKLKIPKAGYPRGDLGSRDPDEFQFSVQDQIAVANGRPVKVGPSKKVPPRARQAPDAFWFVREREHLLTDWVHNDTYGKYFDFPVARFGQCEEFDDRFKMRAPGSCLGPGGRAGYSVKIISPDTLREPLPLGGAGQSSGAILNPPPEGW
jgi:hypothetical protein